MIPFCFNRRKSTDPEKDRKNFRPFLPLMALILCLSVFGVVIATDTGEEPNDTATHISREIDVETALQTDVKRQSMTPAQVYAGQVDAVVGIRTESTVTNVFGQKSSTASSGSGFIVTPSGYVVTNYHVVEGAETITVSLYAGENYVARLVGAYAENDVALLKIEGQGLKHVTLGSSQDLTVGEQIAAIGNPLGELTYSMTVGYVSALDRSINASGVPINMLQTDVAINSGNSGGPIFNMYGDVVAIASAKYSGRTASGAYIEGLSFAIPIDDVKDILRDLGAYGYVTGKPWLGLGLRDLDPSLSQVYGIPEGVLVLSVELGSCAEKAGLREGDLITGFGGKPIRNTEDLHSILRSYRAGDRAELSLYRLGDTRTLTLTLDEKKTAVH